MAKGMTKTALVRHMAEKLEITNKQAAAGLELLAETATGYVELLKKMKRKGEASKLEARIRAVVGKNYKKRA